MPVDYDTPINEYWNTIERAGIWDVAVQRIVEISGPDAGAFTNLLRMVVGAFIDGAMFEKNNEHRWQPWNGGKPAGEVSSAVYSPQLKRNIGLIHANIEYAEPGTRLEVDTAEGRRNLDITTLPFVDPNKAIPRQSLRSTI